MERLGEKMLVEMFNRVGIEVENIEQILEWIDNDPEWYHRKTWTPREQQDFREWGIQQYMESKTSMTKYISEHEVDMFIFNYGWRTDETN